VQGDDRGAPAGRFCGHLHKRAPCKRLDKASAAVRVDGATRLSTVPPSARQSSHLPHGQQRLCAILNSGKQRQQIASAVEAGHRAAGELAGSTLGGDSPAKDRPAYLTAAERSENSLGEI
jgi:hypothetical protein